MKCGYPDEPCILAEDNLIVDHDALYEAVVRAKRRDINEALIQLVRAIPELYNILGRRNVDN